MILKAGEWWSDKWSLNLHKENALKKMPPLLTQSEGGKIHSDLQDSITVAVRSCLS